MNNNNTNQKNFICKCGKEFKNVFSFPAHKGHCKIINPNAKSNRYKNGIPWNKGLTKQTNDKIKRQGEIYSKKVQEGKIIPYWKGKHLPETMRKKISQKLSINNGCGRRKWYEYNNQLLQGTYELNFAKKLDEYQIVWLKIKTNSMTLKWIDENNKKHNYTPDFYLKDYNVYIELKGYWWSNDKHKMELVKIQNTNKNIIIIEKQIYDKIINNEISIKEYIEKHV